MTQQEISVFLFSVIILCALMAVFNLIRNRKRGWPAVIMSAAFLVFGGLVSLYRMDSTSSWITPGIGLLLALLAADFFLRVGNAPTRRGK